MGQLANRTGSRVSIGMRSDQIMQRYLLRRIHREIEFKITETDGTEHTGFITGFDETCVQLSTSPPNDIEEPRAVLVFWPLRRIEETGRRVSDLHAPHQIKIRSYSHALRKACDRVLSGRDQQDDDEDDYEPQYG